MSSPRRRVSAPIATCLAALGAGLSLHRIIEGTGASGGRGGA